MKDIIFLILVAIVLAAWLAVELVRREKQYGEGFDAGIKYQKQENFRRGVMTKDYKWVSKFKLAR